MEVAEVTPSEAPVVAAPADAPAGASAITNVGPADVAPLTEDDGYTLVNVHIPYEGEIPGTDVHIPFDQIEAHLDELPESKDAPVVLYCRSGRMSQIAAETLASLGYTNLLHLDGGMIAWEAANLPLERNASQP